MAETKARGLLATILAGAWSFLVLVLLCLMVGAAVGACQVGFVLTKRLFLG